MQSLERRKEERSFPSSFPHSSHKVSPTLRLSEEKVHLKKKVTAWTPSEHPRMDTLPPEEPLLSLFFFFFRERSFHLIMQEDTIQHICVFQKWFKHWCQQGKGLKEPRGRLW